MKIIHGVQINEEETDAAFEQNAQSIREELEKINAQASDEESERGQALSEMLMDYSAMLETTN